MSFKKLNEELQSQMDVFIKTVKNTIKKITNEVTIMLGKNDIYEEEEKTK